MSALKSAYVHQLNELSLFLSQSNATLTEDEKYATNLMMKDLQETIHDIENIETYQKKLHKMDRESIVDHNIARQLGGLPVLPIEEGIEDDDQNEITTGMEKLLLTRSAPSTSTNRADLGYATNPTLAKAAKAKAHLEYLEEDSDDNLPWGLTLNSAGVNPRDANTKVGPNGTECNTCMHVFEFTLLLECQHRLCRDCIINLVAHAFKDNSLIPLRCCRRDITFFSVMPHISPADFKKLHDLTREKTAVNKMYCPIKTCSIFIDIDEMKEQGRVDVNGQFYCPNLACGGINCSKCFNSHRGLTCAQFESSKSHAVTSADASFAAFAASSKLQRCSNCRAHVELISGCNHVTCNCGFDFCFQCGLKWKTCKCVAWEEANIIREAARRAGERANNVAVVERLRNTIRREVDCAAGEHNWIEVQQRGGDCRNCAFYMHIYHFRCGTCRLSPICYTCRHHRIG